MRRRGTARDNVVQKKPRSSRRTANTPAQRNLPARGFRPATMLVGVGLITLYGWYRIIKGIREKK